ncbi:hypothetical protein [Niveispirillum fermenti]|uniref:hypothetical protein n=1 Tax=Niveispirillum fermenti TaxID=1233113 RepID=UPI003A8A3B0D
MSEIPIMAGRRTARFPLCSTCRTGVASTAMPTIRNLTLSQIIRRARQDHRNLPYDLLPLSGGPGRRRWLAWLATLGRPRMTSPPQQEARRLHEQLLDRGYTEPLALLTAGQAMAARDWFDDQDCHDPYRPHLGRFRHGAVPSEETNMGYYSQDQILAAPGLWALFNHPLVLDVAGLFLGCKPTLDNIGAWWSFTARTQAKGTQWFHRDWDNIRGFKLFVYLSDVGPDDGPFEYVATSQRDERLVEINRLSDEKVATVLGDLPSVSVTGAAGTVFLADTFGVHRGRLPLARSRLLATAQYGVWRTPHSAPQPFMPRRDGFDPYINRALMR